MALVATTWKVRFCHCAGLRTQFVREPPEHGAQWHMPMNLSSQALRASMSHSLYLPSYYLPACLEPSFRSGLTRSKAERSNSTYFNYCWDFWTTEVYFLQSGASYLNIPINSVSQGIAVFTSRLMTEVFQRSSRHSQKQGRRSSRGSRVLGKIEKGPSTSLLPSYPFSLPEKTHSADRESCRRAGNADFPRVPRWRGQYQCEISSCPILRFCVGEGMMLDTLGDKVSTMEWNMLCKPSFNA